MNKRVKHVLFLVGVLLSGAIALLPLTSYAEETRQLNPPYNCTGKANNIIESITDGSKTGSLGASDVDNHCPTSDASTTFRLNVKDVIWLDASVSSAPIEVYPDRPGTGSLNVSVWSNKKYTISLSAQSPSLSNGSTAIQAADITNLNSFDGAGWGIKKSGASGYSKLTTSPATFYTSTDADLNKMGDWVNGSPSAVSPTTFDVGVVVNMNIPTATYSTEVTVTAATATN